MAKTKTVLVAAAASLWVCKQSAFVPPAAQKSQRVAIPASALAGTAAAMGAAPAFADEIGDAAKKLSAAAYPFMSEVDWNSLIFAGKPGSAGALEWLKAVDTALVMGNDMDPALLKAGVQAHIKAIANTGTSGLLPRGDFEAVNAAIGRMIASVPESKTMAVYDSFAKLVSKDVPPYLMSTVDSGDAKAAYSALMEFKDVVKANPISHAETPMGAIDPAIAKAAATLSAKSYPLIQKVDWTSDIYSAPLPGVLPKAALKAVDSALEMSVAMDPKALHTAVEAHHKAISGVTGKGVPTAADYEAINAAIGQLIATTPTTKTMGVYNAFAKIVSPDVGKYMMAMVDAKDAKAAYEALMTFKDTVKAVNR